ncbi:MAG: hypothetical protein KC502_13040 [Myxococcales bacterium]|nr:hypothetical protein [Myxococcales bacterium]
MRRRYRTVFSMNKLKYSRKLLAEIALFARENKLWWLVPLVLVLLLGGLLAVAGQSSMPFIYALF